MELRAWIECSVCGSDSQCNSRHLSLHHSRAWRASTPQCHTCDKQKRPNPHLACLVHYKKILMSNMWQVCVSRHSYRQCRPSSLNNSTWMFSSSSCSAWLSSGRPNTNISTFENWCTRYRPRLCWPVPVSARKQWLNATNLSGKCSLGIIWSKYMPASGISEVPTRHWSWPAKK